MGKWEELQSSVSRLIGRKTYGKHPSDAGTALVSHATKVADAVRVNGAQKLDEYFPDPHRREKLSRVLSHLGKFAVDSAVNESLKSVTGRIV